jgi:hypothetical protein
MDFLILVGQRNCSYEGQYAPEVLAAIDSNGNDDNPDFLAEMRELHQKSKEFDSLAVMTIRVSGAAVTEALYPAAKAIKGEVV